MVSPGRSSVSGGIATPLCLAWYRSAASLLTSASPSVTCWVVCGASALMISNLEQLPPKVPGHSQQLRRTDWRAGSPGRPGRVWPPETLLKKEIRPRGAGPRGLIPSGGVHAKLPQAVAVLRGPGGAVHPDVSPGSGDVQRLVTAVPTGGRVHGGPGRAVGGRLELECGRVSGLPVQDDLADRLGGAEIDLEP